MPGSPLPAPPDPVDTFFTAVAQGDTRAVREHLDHQPSLLAALGPGGVRAPLVALYRGHTALADELAGRSEPLDVHEAGAFDDNGRLRVLLLEDITCATLWSVDGWQPLHLAARFGRGEAVRQLLDDDAPVDAVSRNRANCTPLHAATAGSHGEIVWLLIASGADVDAREEGGSVPLHTAAAHGDVESVRALLSAGATRDLVNDAGQTPSDLAPPAVRELLA